MVRPVLSLSGARKMVQTVSAIAAGTQRFGARFPRCRGELGSGARSRRCAGRPGLTDLRPSALLECRVGSLQARLPPERLKQTEGPRVSRTWRIAVSGGRTHRIFPVHSFGLRPRSDTAAGGVFPGGNGGGQSTVGNLQSVLTSRICSTVSHLASRKR